MKFFILGIFLVLSLGSSALSAQDTFEEYRRRQEQNFQQFKDERDKAFMDMLERTWREMEAFKAGTTYVAPKPVSVPAAPDRPNLPVVIGEDIVIREEFDIPVPEIRTEPIRLPAAARPFLVDFHATDIPLRTIPSPMLAGSVNQETIRKYWGDMSASDYGPIVHDLAKIRTDLGLNDWGYLMLLNSIAKKAYPNRPNERVLMVWFYLIKSDYDVRIGFNSTRAHLLTPIDNTLYNASFLTLNGKRFYVIQFDNAQERVGSLFTYEGDYPGVTKRMNLAVDREVKLATDMMERELNFTHQGKRYEIRVPINRNAISYYEMYPQTDYPVYPMSKGTGATLHSLTTQLKVLLEGQSQADAARTLLNFVQTAFEYKTDQDQFGREKWMMPEETLFYPYSDCDDRAILYAYLVRELIGLEVVGLLYPSHLTTAILLPGVQGDMITHNGKRYLAADPTYIGADIGMTMPQLKGETPQVIEIR
jgi:hypothetical protein